MSRRMLLLHPKKGWEDDDIKRALARLREGTPSRYTWAAGRDAYAAHFKRLRSWDAWEREVGAGTRLDGEPLYHGYVVPGEECARATAKIVEHALRVGKPVFAWDMDAPGVRLQRVESIVDEEPKNRWWGWRLVLAPAMPTDRRSK